MKKSVLVMTFSTCIASTAVGQSVPGPETSASDTSVTVSFGAFVDSYFAYDFDRPRSLDRPFTTQAVRHNEFNVNLALIEAKVLGERVRGRLALQAGTSVQSNYSGEPAIGSVSGPSLARMIQEAVAGYRLTPSLWIDGGIFFSHIGMESFISRDNPTYTRSLAAEFTPYYESGAKLTWQASQRLTGTLVAVNGWQNISENNDHKALGLRLDLAATPATSFGYYNFFGRENASGNQRFFNGIGFKTTLAGGMSLQANGDYGIQEKEDGGESTWYSAALIGRIQPTSKVAVSGRLEAFHDPDQVIIATGVSDGFEGTTASAGLDVMPLGSTRVMWRSEVRGTWTSNPVFTRRSESVPGKDNYLIVTSLGVTF